jgi:uncharacterized membrane protein
VDLSERKRVRVENRQRDAIDVVRVPDRMVVVPMVVVLMVVVLMVVVLMVIALMVIVLMVVVQIHLNAARE